LRLISRNDRLGAMSVVRAGTVATGASSRSFARKDRTLHRLNSKSGDTPMLHRMFALLAIVGLCLLVTAPVMADEKENVAEGVVVKAADGKLTIADKEKKEHTCEVAKDAKITCNGKECKLDDLKKGAKVKVTLEKKMAVKIEATLKKDKSK
jgi:biopolymer transport protein ExbD